MIVKVRSWLATFIVAAMVLVALLSAPLTAFAQDASVVGKVTDQSGGVLPGVTVTSAFRDESAKDATRTSSVFATRRIQPAVTQSASGRFIPVRLRCRSSEPFGCKTTPGGCGGCFVPSCTSIRTPVKPSRDGVLESCQRRSPGELTDGMCA